MLLKGIRILDLTRLLPGGFCTMILSDLGADVVKIEEPMFGDYIRVFPPFVNGVGVFHYAVNRGKKSVALNLKDDGDREKFYKLVEEADVVVESFRIGVPEKLGIDFNTLKKYNPKIVYCSIRGYAGEKSDKPIHDLNAQALSGILDLHIKVYGENVKPLIPIGDLSAGLMCAISILSGLIHAKRTGEGVKMDVGLVESSLLLNMIAVIGLLNDGKLEDLIGIKPKPYYTVMKTKDNKYYSIAPIEEKFWEIFENMLGIKIRDRESEEAYKEVERAFKNLTSNQVEEYITKNPCCVEKIVEIDELPKKKELAPIFKKVDKATIMLTPIYVNGKLKGRLEKPPEIGEENKKQ